MTKAKICPSCEKIKEPIWCSLEENVSFIFLETTPEGRGEALLSFWSEPFMSKSAGRDIPRSHFVPGLVGMNTCAGSAVTTLGKQSILKI